VGAALRPIETTECETAALGAGGFDIEAEAGERAFAFGSEEVGVVATGVGGARGLEPACGDEAVVERDGDGAGHVVVTTAGGAKMDGRGGSEAIALATGEDAEAFESASNGGRGERVVTVTALHEDADEMVGFEAIEVDAGGGRRDTGDDGQLGADAGRAFHEAEEHAGAGGLADGGGDGGDGGVDAGFHCFTVDEVLR